MMTNQEQIHDEEYFDNLIKSQVPPGYYLAEFVPEGSVPGGIPHCQITIEVEEKIDVKEQRSNA